MREKKWVDCPICGSKKSMRQRTNFNKKVKLKDYPALTIKGLDGQFCNVCKDGFLSKKADRVFYGSVAEHRARVDAARILACDVASVQDAAKALQISAQGVHKMIREGRLRSVYVAGKRMPLKADVAEKAAPRARAKKAA